MSCDTDLYFEYLCDRYLLYGNNAGLARILFDTPFRVVNDRDTNREDDGLYLRIEYMDASPVDKDYSTLLKSRANMLEVLGALATHMSFTRAGWTEAYWFWRLLCNGDVDWISDELLAMEPELELVVRSWLKRINDRTYQRNGSGGLFPIRNFHNADELPDQRTVELWYQMSQWLISEYNTE